MKKLNNLPESSFLKLFFAFVSFCFIIAAICLPDLGVILKGMRNIL